MVQGLPGTFPVPVSTPSGKMLTLMMDSNNTVSQLKDAIRSSEGFLYSHQKLVAADEELENGIRLSTIDLSQPIEIELV